jgi:hypothetical protein
MQMFVHDEAAVNVVGTHGALYLIYLLVALPVTRRPTAVP